MPLHDYQLPDSRPEGRAPLTERQLLHSVVEMARLLFGAAAASIFLVDGDTGELVFEAVSGKGDAHLPGTRFPSGTGIAGWVAMSGQPVHVDDLASSALFARGPAESTGFVPNSLMAAPLIRESDCLGVLEVLDPSAAPRGELTDLDVLGLLAVQAAIGLEILIRARGRVNGTAPADEHVLLLDRIGAAMSTAAPATVTLASSLLTAVEEVLVGRR